jgi:hypothetical protein
MVNHRYPTSKAIFEAGYDIPSFVLPQHHLSAWWAKEYPDFFTMKVDWDHQDILAEINMNLALPSNLIVFLYPHHPHL